ncbi:transmembrane protein 53-like [Argopecten irradians]|uniref:transmembrane protein 53-like n=1 Tax=Argopecten irradians TaxID=31199 RepID=UPI0037148EEC
MMARVNDVISLTNKGFRLNRTLFRTFHTETNNKHEVSWTKRIDRNLELRAPKQDGVVQHARPLMLLFGWMLAKRKHIQKYEEYYLNRGYNVMTVSASPLDILMPSRAQGIARKIIEQIEYKSRDAGRQPILLHGFSVGGYLIGELHVKLNTTKTIARELLVAQIFDSPVDVDGIPKGFSTDLTENPALRVFIRSSLNLYMAIFKKNVSKFVTASEAFKYNRYCVPSLFLYSTADKVVKPETVEGFIHGYKQRGIVVRSRCWKDSAHVSHFYCYPVEYMDILTIFLNKHAPIAETSTSTIKHTSISVPSS